MPASSLGCGREVRLAVGLRTAPASALATCTPFLIGTQLIRTEHRFADLEGEWVDRSEAPADATLFERAAVGPAA